MPRGVSESPSESLVALMVAGGGHHLDLMFSNSVDPESVREAEAPVDHAERQRLRDGHVQRAQLGELELKMRRQKVSICEDWGGRARTRTHVLF